MQTLGKQEPVEPDDAPCKVLDTGKYKKMKKGQKLQNEARQSYVFSTALLFNEIYLSIKFRDDISYSFRIMSRVKFFVCLFGFLRHVNTFCFVCLFA
jgi:hypothetical protein